MAAGAFAESGADLRARRDPQDLPRVHRDRGARSADPRGIVLRPARPVGLRQDDDPAPRRRARGPDRGPHPHRRPGCHRGEAAQAPGQHGVPELRAVPAHDGDREHRVRAEAAQSARMPSAKAHEALRLVELDHVANAAPQSALGRSAAARRARPRDRQPPGAPAAGRAARRARPQAAAPDAARAQVDPGRGRPDLPARHARPGGGHDDGRHRGRHEPRAHRAARVARRSSTSCRAPDSSRASSASRTSSRPTSSRPRAA